MAPPKPSPPPPATPLLQVQDLGFGWPGQPPLFQGWGHGFAAGLTWLQGDEGCGKSTLLQLLAGVQRPSAGRVCCRGVDAAQAPAAHRRQVFWCPADPLDRHGALGAQAFFARLAAAGTALDAALLPQLLDALGLQPHLGKRVDQLSTGSRRKLVLAAALAAQAPVVLLDEPLAALDRASVAFVQDALADAAHAREQAWVVASHTPLGAAEAWAMPLVLGGPAAHSRW